MLILQICSNLPSPLVHSNSESYCLTSTKNKYNNLLSLESFYWLLLALMFLWNEITAQDESHRSSELPGLRWRTRKHGAWQRWRWGLAGGWRWWISYIAQRTSLSPLPSSLSRSGTRRPGPSAREVFERVFVTWIMVHIYIYTSVFTAHVNIDLPEINLRKGRLLLPFKDLNNNILLANLTSRTMKPISHLPEKPPWPFSMSIWSRNIFHSGFSNEETRKYKVTADTENCDEADFKTRFWWLVEKFSIKISNFLFIIQTDKEIKSYLIKF